MKGRKRTQCKDKGPHAIPHNKSEDGCVSPALFERAVKLARCERHQCDLEDKGESAEMKPCEHWSRARMDRLTLGGPALSLSNRAAASGLATARPMRFRVGSPKQCKGAPGAFTLAHRGEKVFKGAYENASCNGRDSYNP